MFEDLRKAGFVRARVDGEICDVAEEVALDRYRNHTIEAVVDRLVVRHGGEGLDRTRLTDSVETALELGDGVLVVSVLGTGDGEGAQDVLFSEHFACPQCGISLPAIEPRSFSFNSPHGACPHCQGLGMQKQVDPSLLVPNADLSVRAGAIAAWSSAKNEAGYYGQILAAVAETYRIDLDLPWRSLSPEERTVLLNGSGERAIEVHYKTRDGRRRQYRTLYEGVITNLMRRYESTDSDYVRGEIEKYMTERPCPICEGGRLRPEMVAVTVAGQSIVQASRLTTQEALAWLAELTGSDDAPSRLSERDLVIGAEILKEIRQRLGFLVDVGLDYLTLERRAASLAGGEAQRIRLATQIGSQLMGVLYVLDEPSIGLHPRDNARLIRTLLGLRDVGNTVLVVEHDEETIRSADWIVDLGPGPVPTAATWWPRERWRTSRPAPPR